MKQIRFFRFCFVAVVAVLSVFLSACVTPPPPPPPLAPQTFFDKMAVHGFRRDEIEAGLSLAQKRDDIIALMTKPAEAVKPWKEYAPIFLTEVRLKNGVEFWQANATHLQRAETEFGVPAEIICAIIGVETNYGRIMGKHRVLDALYTLGFHYAPRAPYFSGELEQYFLLSREQQWPLDQAMGSYAGAMGMGQFMPTSYRKWAIDYDGDGKVNLFASQADAIGSVANYFKVHGWQTDGAVMLPAFESMNVSGVLPATEKPVEPFPKSGMKPLSQWAQSNVKPTMNLPGHYQALWLAFDEVEGRRMYFGFNNFLVITKYNRSPMYARAVYEFSLQLRSAFDGTPFVQTVNKL